MCNENMCGGGSCSTSDCKGCNCSPEMTLEMLEKKEKHLKEGLEWVEAKKKELGDSN